MTSTNSLHEIFCYSFSGYAAKDWQDEGFQIHSRLDVPGGCVERFLMRKENGLPLFLSFREIFDEEEYFRHHSHGGDPRQPNLQWLQSGLVSQQPLMSLGDSLRSETEDGQKLFGNISEVELKNLDVCLEGLVVAENFQPALAGLDIPVLSPKAGSVEEKYFQDTKDFPLWGVLLKSKRPPKNHRHWTQKLEFRQHEYLVGEEYISRFDWLLRWE